MYIYICRELEIIDMIDQPFIIVRKRRSRWTGGSLDIKSKMHIQNYAEFNAALFISLFIHRIYTPPYIPIGITRWLRKCDAHLIIVQTQNTFWRNGAGDGAIKLDIIFKTYHSSAGTITVLLNIFCDMFVLFYICSCMNLMPYVVVFVNFVFLKKDGQDFMLFLAIQSSYWQTKYWWHFSYADKVYKNVTT